MFGLIAIIGCSNHGDDTSLNSWEVYGGSASGIKYSSLRQVDTSNVSQLKVAWIYNSGDADSAHDSQIQCNPVIIGNVLYGINPAMKLFAVDASSGKQLWTFDPNSFTAAGMDSGSFHIMINCRGVCYWKDGDDARIFFTAGSDMYAINAKDGKPIRGFGEGGRIDLRKDLGRDPQDLFVVNSSPGIIYKDLLIVGTRVSETLPSAPGHIRAYDTRTGKLKWIFHTIPQPGEFGFDTWEDSTAWKTIGGANAWSGFTLDAERGLVFAGTGSAAFDFYGGNRKGANLFANCVLALDANTGKRIWHYQVTHHDVWDRDLPTAPVLVSIDRNGKKTDAVAQTTKMGYVFVLDRETGKPLFDVDEMPVDTVSDLKGEKLWPTQPVPKKPLAFVRQHFSEKDLNTFLPDTSFEQIKSQYSTYRSGEMYLPPGKQTSVLLPGYGGGAEWGGPSWDPGTGILYVNANESACLMQIVDVDVKAKAETNLEAGQRLYRQHCMTCHGPDRKGNDPNPSLIGVAKKYGEEEFLSLLRSGRRMMPAFPQIAAEEKTAVASFVLDEKKIQSKPFISQGKKDDALSSPYQLKGYTRFLTPEGYQAIAPPWGTLTAIDLNSGNHLWQVPLGEYEELQKQGVPQTGTVNYGGGVVTAGGLLFIAATRDSKLRAFNKRTGKLLWEYKLPAPGFATPAVYEIDGKQYIVIACGGGKLGTNVSDAYIAFSL